MKRRTKWLKAMSITLSCAMLATTAPVNVLADEVVTEETQENVTQVEFVNETEGNSELEDNQNIIANDETGIPDKAFYELVLGRADSNKDGILTKEEASELKYLNVEWADISNIKGIEYCKNLTSLILYGNQITDISALESLTNLTELDLSNNQIKDVSTLKNLVSLTDLNLSNNEITDVSSLADLVLKHNLKRCNLEGNDITTIGNFPEYVTYDEEVEIRYLADDDRNRIIELLGLSEYDGKVICMDSPRNGEFVKFYPYGDDGYGHDYSFLRTDNGDLTLGKPLHDGWLEGFHSFSGYCFVDSDVSDRIIIFYENDYVWLIHCGDVDSSGLKFTDKVEKTKVVEPFAKKDSGATISKSFEREYGRVSSGTLNEQDVQTVMDYFRIEFGGGSFSLIPTEGSEYTIDFTKSSYGKDELSELSVSYYSLSRNEDGSMNIKWLESGCYDFKNGKLYDYNDIAFLTKGDIGADIEDCEFYIPAMNENSDEVILTFVQLFTLDERWSGNLIVYNDEKTLEVCNFTEIKEPVVTVNPFSDVSETQYYYAPVLWALEKGITAGYDATHFAPEDSCTRGQVVTFLWRALGKPEPTITENPFVDVPNDTYYTKAVLWALEKGITSGYDATHFAPEDIVTREQFVTFLHRVEQKPAYTVTNPFVDVAQGTPYYDAILWAYENKITTGYNDTEFAPQDNCTRGQVVTFLYRGLSEEE